MEKYRKFSDIQNGIQPFVTIIDPTWASFILSLCTFPVRIVLVIVSVVLIFLLDLLSIIFYYILPGRVRDFLSSYFITPPKHGCLRAILFLLGNLVLRYHRDDKKWGGSTPTSANSVQLHPKEGEILMANLQSPWDWFVLEVALNCPYAVVVFPSLGAENNSVVFWPGPCQRWRIWLYIWSTGSKRYLHRACNALSTGMKSSVNLKPLQEAARKVSIPLLFFFEGTCSNGKGVLPLGCDSFLMTCDLDSAPCNLEEVENSSPKCLAATVAYDTPAIHTIISEKKSVMAYLLSMGSILYGSRSAMWRSPLMPSAKVSLVAARFSRAVRTSEGCAGSKSTSCWLLNNEGLGDIRQALCQFGKHPVTLWGGARRRPLTVGICEKSGYLDALISNGEC